MGELIIQQTQKGKMAIMDNAGGLDGHKWKRLARDLENSADIKMLILKGSYTLSESEEMLAALRANQSLECVTLRDSSIGNSLSNVIDSLSANKKLNYLLLSTFKENNGVLGDIDDAFMSSLASLITNNSGLKRLNLENISFTNENFLVLCQALATTLHLRELVLINITLSPENRQRLIDALSANSRIRVSMDNCGRELELALNYNPDSFYPGLSSPNYPWLLLRDGDIRPQQYSDSLARSAAAAASATHTLSFPPLQLRAAANVAPHAAFMQHAAIPPANLATEPTSSFSQG